MAKKKPGKPTDPLQALAKRVRALEEANRVRSDLEAKAARAMNAASADAIADVGIKRLERAMQVPVLPTPPRLSAGDVLAKELLQQDYQRLRGERLATVRQSLGLSRRPWRDLLPRWLHRLLDRCGGL